MKPIFRPRRMKSYLYSIAIALLLSLLFLAHHAFHQTSRIDDPLGKTAILYANQINDDLTQKFVQAIGRAKESVLLIVYTLTDPAIIKALKQKSAEGIEVKVISDAREAPYVTPRLGPSVHTIRRFSEGRMHQKILVIDGKTTWIGSANMTSESLKMHGNLVSVIDSSPFSLRMRAKAQTMLVEGTNGSFSHEEFNVDGQVIELWFLPDDRSAVSRVINLIRSAQKSVRIAMFTWTRMDFAHAAIDAANRGVDVEVVIDGNQGKGSSSRVVERLKNSKVKVSLSRGAGLLHHKFLYVDNNTLLNGSANWTRDAFNKNDECFIIIHNLRSAQRQQMDALWNVISKESVRLKN